MQRRIGISSLLLVLLSLPAFRAIHGQDFTRTGPPIKVIPLVRLVENEGDGCFYITHPYPTVFTFKGMIGRGKFPTGTQKLTVEQYDGYSIRIRREDTIGPHKGSTAVYEAYIDGNSFLGDVFYYEKGSSGPPGRARWCGIIEAPKSVPKD